MNRRFGFTTVELLVTIVIMAILLTLGVVNLRSSQINARDAERQTDVENIARGLEQRYTQGNPKATSADISIGTYPGTNEIRHAQGVSLATYMPNQIAAGYLTDLLPGTSTETFTGPGSGTFEVICSASCGAAENTTTVNTATTVTKYIYEPIDASNAICTGAGCVRFNLYYRRESDNTVQKVTSKNQ